MDEFNHVFDFLGERLVVPERLGISLVTPAVRERRGRAAWTATGPASRAGLGQALLRATPP